MEDKEEKKGHGGEEGGEAVTEGARWGKRRKWRIRRKRKGKVGKVVMTEEEKGEIVLA